MKKFRNFSQDSVVEAEVAAGFKIELTVLNSIRSVGIFKIR